MLPRIPCRTTPPLALDFPKLSDHYSTSIYPNSHHHQATHLPLRWHNAVLNVDDDVTLDSGMKEEGGDSTGVPGSKLSFERLNSS